MKKLKYIVVTLVAIIATSCGDDFLNPLPDTAISVDSFFASDDDVLAGIYGIYDISNA